MANPEETGFIPYAVTVSGSTITIGNTFGGGAAQTVQSPTASSVLYGREIITIVGESNTNEYIGAATNSSGTPVGILVLDETTNKYYLLSKTTLTRNSTLTLHTSTGIADPNPDNWNLSTQTSQSFCFMAGTAIRTPLGEVAVETLKAGDRVLLAEGGSAEISWLGRQTISMQFADPLRVLPVRIKADALGEGMPARDLLISPDHAILVDGILVQAAAIMNGTSIVREACVPPVFTYYHVEVASHALILAENLAAETFIDNVDRLGFDNWEEHQNGHAATDSIPEMSYPRAKSFRQVPQATSRRLRYRADALFAKVPAAA